MALLIPGFFAEIPDALIFIILALLAAGWNWIRNKMGDQNEDTLEEPWPKTTPPPTRRASTQEREVPEPESWEEEIKRLLRGEPPSPAPPATPPVTRRVEAPPPPPFPYGTPKPPPIPGGRHSVPEPHRPPPIIQQATQEGPGVSEALERLRQLSPKRSTVSLADSIAERLRQASLGNPSEQMEVHKRKAASNRDVIQVRRLFQNPQSARQAILASVILAPPKSLSD